jgi:hypothetical protein
MTFELTNKNIRVRFILEKQKREAAGGGFTYEDAAKLFDISDRTFYTWITMLKPLQHKPMGTRRKKVLKWLEDGVMETYYKNKGKK